LENLNRCRLNGTRLVEVLDLGLQPLGNGFVIPGSDAPEYTYDLRCGFSVSSLLFQLLEQPKPELMFHESYAFVSGTSRAMQHHFALWADSIIDRWVSPVDSPFVVELGCNDGILLTHSTPRS
jgi:methylation protein EvaC